ncbi:MAG: zinc-ribbon and DUF3426 domain-containing protein [Steroidobacteraceae bacterium]
MITICPQCQLPLAVTATDLRVAQGQVRCGRCAAVFNALASLYEPGNAPTTAGAPGTATPAPTPPAAPVPAPPPGPTAAPEPAAGTTRVPDTTTVFDASALRDGAPSLPLSGSGLFRSLSRDDEPRFDDTHGADDWPDELAAGLTPREFPAAPEANAAPDTDGTSPPDPPAPVRVAAEPGTAPVAEVTDTFVREEPDPTPPAPEPDTDTLRRAPSSPPEVVVDELELDGMQAQRDWQADTMTAADLAALVGHDGSAEPPEFASIEIAVDDASEITVLPSESAPATAATAARAPLAAPAPDPAPQPTPQADRGGATFPRLHEAPDDDPDLAGARLEAAGRRAALDAGSAPLRWLEIEEPAASAASTEPAAPRGARAALLPTPVDFVVAPPDAGATDAPPAAGDAAAADAVAGPADVGPLARALGLDADLAPLAAPATPAADEVAAELAAGAGTRPASAPRWMWAATLLLALALGAQLVHLYREELVAVPALREPLTAIYASLGRPLQPRWDLAGYELRQQGVVAEPVAAGTLTVRASIRNGAGRAQPAPLLRVTLQDRFGNRIATRDLTPREYGGAAAIAPAPMLAPGQRIDAEVSLLDPGGEAVGFELDVCLRRTDAAVVCANDAPTAHG